MTTFPPEFCPHCGGDLAATREEGRERACCPDCERVVYHNPVPAACVVVGDGDRVLLVRRAVEPWAGEWTVPGGHVETGESPRAAAVRELEEETGLRVDAADLSLVYSAELPPHGGKHAVTFGFAVGPSAAAGEARAGTDADAVRRFDARAVRDGDADVPVRSHVPDAVGAALDRVGPDEG